MPNVRYKEHWTALPAAVRSSIALRLVRRRPGTVRSAAVPDRLTANQIEFEIETVKLSGAGNAQPISQSRKHQLVLVIRQAHRIGPFGSAGSARSPSSPSRDRYVERCRAA